MTFLSDYDGQRQNNFTLLRLTFATMVLVGHSYPITGNGSDYFTKLMLPHAWIGSLAVAGFFSISGFLVTASISHRGPAQFIAARALRLYPAVFVYMAVAVLIIGPLGSDVSIKTYFEANPWDNFWNVLLWDWKYNLPYVFQHNPFAGSTKGSSWTLPLELKCYIVVFGLGLLGVYKRRWLANCLLLISLWAVKFHFDWLPLGGSAPSKIERSSTF